MGLDDSGTEPITLLQHSPIQAKHSADLSGHKVLTLGRQDLPDGYKAILAVYKVSYKVSSEDDHTGSTATDTKTEAKTKTEADMVVILVTNEVTMGDF